MTGDAGDDAQVAVPGSPVRTGIWLFPDRDADELVDLIVLAEDLGLDEVWLGDEGPAREPFTVLAAAATRTTRISLGVAVTNPYVRAPALTVSTALTVHELSHGRMMLGVGAGGQLSLGPFGLAAEKPLARVREFVETARAVMGGHPGPGYVPSALTVGVDDDAPMPIYIGARGPMLNRLASSIADGAFVAGMPPFRYDEVIENARAVRDIDISLYPGVAFDESSLERQRALMIWGLLDTPATVRERLGLDSCDVEAAARELASGNDRKARAIVDDHIVPELVLIGEPATVGARLESLAAEVRPASIGLALSEHNGRIDIERAARALGCVRHTRECC